MLRFFTIDIWKKLDMKTITKWQWHKKYETCQFCTKKCLSSQKDLSSHKILKKSNEDVLRDFWYFGLGSSLKDFWHHKSLSQI